VFVERVADGLGHAAFDLAGRQHRVNHAADFLQRDEIIDLRLAGDGVHRHLGHIDRPRVRAVRIALIRLIVPVNSRRRFVAARAT
jgi:hypothetical protein